MKKPRGRFTIDTSFTFAKRILHLSFVIGASVIIARVLGPYGKGIYALAILFPSLVKNFGSFGLGQATIFYVGKKKYSPREILGNNIVFSFLFGIIGSLIGFIIILFFSDILFPGITKVYLFLGLLLIPLLFFISYVIHILLGMQKIKEYNFSGINESFIFLILVSILLLGFKFGIQATIIAKILSSLIGSIILFFLVKKIIGDFSLAFNRTYFKNVIQFGFKIYLGNLITFLHYRIDIILINIFLNPVAVGLYTLAGALSEKIWLISQSAGTVLYPRVASERNTKNIKEFTPLVCRNILFLSGIGAILLFYLSSLLIVFAYSEKFLDSIFPFKILLIGAVSISGWRILANDLYGRGKPELNIYISFFSLFLNIILNIFWIPKYGISGAAFATSISYTFAFITISIVYSRISGNPISKIVFIQKSDFTIYKGLIILIIQRLIQLHKIKNIKAMTK